MIQKQHLQNLFFGGGTFLIIGALTKLFEFSLASYVFSFGVAIIIFIQALNAFDRSKTDKNQQRLARLGLFNSLFLVIGAYFMFNSSNSWVVCVLIYSLTTLYLSFRVK
jgi:hypothetical protein